VTYVEKLDSSAHCGHLFVKLNVQPSITLLVALIIKGLFLAGLKCVEIMAKLLALLFLTTLLVSIIVSIVLLRMS